MFFLKFIGYKEMNEVVFILKRVLFFIFFRLNIKIVIFGKMYLYSEIIVFFFFIKK